MTSSIPAAPCATPPTRCSTAGREAVYAYITHGVLSGGAVARISASNLKELVITDSIEPTEAVRVSQSVRTLSIAPLIGEAIGRTAQEESVSSLFD
jgi:ribose-phosphate pyrophosphokinase